jgi:putative redox protein
MKATVTLSDGLRFTGMADSGHSIVMDGPEKAGGSDSAARPAELMLLALAGCTAMDVISILRKKRQKVTDFSVTVTGEPREDYPAVYEKLQVTYSIRGTDIDPAAVERSIELSEGKYCSVGATLKFPVAIESSYRITPDAE